MARDPETMMRRLTEAADEAGTMLAKLQPLLAEPEGHGPATGTIGRSAPESREPWAQQAAGAYWDIYFGARTLAQAMRESAGLLPLFGDVFGSDALSIVVNMGPTVSDLVLRGAVHDLERWVSRAREIAAVDEEEPWTELPRTPGRQPIECPYCHTYGLRMLVRKGDVRCIFPGCTDSDGNPTRARMEPGRMTGEERLVFGDGTTMGGEA